MSNARGSICVAAVVVTTALAGCSASPDDGATPGPETVTVTYSSSTSNAPKTQTVTSSPSSTRGSGSGSNSSTSDSSPSPDSSSTSSSSTSDSSEDLPTSPAGYADAFVRAWGRGDRSAASTYGTTTAVSTLFSDSARGGAGWTRRATTGYAGSTEVEYSDGSRTLLVVVDHGALGAGEEHAVTIATFGDGSATQAPGDGLPQTRTAYADAFVRAWGKSDSGAWDYAVDSVRTALGGGPGPDAGSWRRTSATGSSVTYRDGSGSTLVLTLDDNRVQSGLKDAITGATLS